MLDWDDLRYFLAVARAGTLSGAARVLGVAQPTVGRRLTEFERHLGTRLVQRRATGLVLTMAGETLREFADRMEREALGAERTIAGRDAGVRGAVRITASEWLAARVIAPMLAELLELHPELSIDLVADARHFNLGSREADLALRPSKFAHASIFSRSVARIGFGLYASPTYLARRGRPDLGTHCDGHTLIALSDSVGDVTRAWLASCAGNVRNVVKTNGREPMAAMAVAGVGLACLPRIMGDGTVGLRLVGGLPGPLEPTLWLGVHRDVRSVPRVRTVSTFLAEGLRRLQPALTPEAHPIGL
jgi:DNA-binding transcriptional LysR family regulator